MPLYFRCDACGMEQQCDDYTGEVEFARNCAGCGMDGCDLCLQHGLCKQCWQTSQWDSDDEEAQ